MKFKPSLLSSLVLAALATTFLALGRWQLERAGEKEALVGQFANPPSAQSLQEDRDMLAFTRLELTGLLDPQRHFMLDNQVFGGRPGVHVLTPFRDSATGRWLLVNRGWLPLPPDRSHLPEVPTPAGHVTVIGHLQGFRSGGIRLGEPDQLRQDQWPQLVTYPDRLNLAGALGEELSSWVLYLAPEDASGFAGRDWKATSMGPEKHRGYALQWFALATTAFGAWLVLGLRRARETRL